jgi:hypothetical protein
MANTKPKKLTTTPDDVVYIGDSQPLTGKTEVSTGDVSGTTGTSGSWLKPGHVFVSGAAPAISIKDTTGAVVADSEALLKLDASSLKLLNGDSSKTYLSLDIASKDITIDGSIYGKTEIAGTNDRKLASTAFVRGELLSATSNLGGLAVYNTVGTHSFTVPTGITRIKVLVISGGGGGGGSFVLSGPLSRTYPGGPGGHGGLATGYITVTPGATIPVIVGGGGGGGAPSSGNFDNATSGGAGGASQFSTLIATGGGGGSRASSVGGGGAGGGGTGSGGTYNYPSFPAAFTLFRPGTSNYGANGAGGSGGSGGGAGVQGFVMLEW